MSRAYPGIDTQESPPCPQRLQRAVCRYSKAGGNQIVQIPREFELPGNEAILRRDEDGRLTLEPIQRKNLSALLASWKPLRGVGSLPEVEDMPVKPVRL